MIHSPKFTAVLDACVIYPAPIRDLLLNLAEMNLYKPKWTKQIHEEWKSNVLKSRTEIKSSQLDYTIEMMDSSFPDSMVENYEELISALDLPDKDDNHVLAAAIRCKADVIVTNNLKDFPNFYLANYDLEAQSADVFVSNLIDLNPQRAFEAFKNQVRSLKRPKKTLEEVLLTLENCGLKSSSKKLEAINNSL